MANTLSRKLPEMLAVRMFFDFKGTHSIILLAVCDARYRFLVVDLWDAGRHSDSRVFSSFPLGKAWIAIRFHFLDSCEPENHQFTTQLELLMWKTVGSVMLLELLEVT